MSFSDEQLKLAFAVYIAQLIVDADEVTDYTEIKLWGQIFPRNLLRAAEFVDDDGAFTDTFEAARQTALSSLPKSLDDSEKLELLTLFYGTSMADGELEPRELEVLKKGADLLGIAPTSFTQHIADLSSQ